MADILGKAVEQAVHRCVGALLAADVQHDTAVVHHQRAVAKGDVLGVARVAGIMAVKQTAHLIPMCHTLLITKCSVDFEVDEKELTIKAFCTAKLEGKPGVEMEALTGVSVALLTIYDMCKAIDRGMRIDRTLLLHKDGGRSGEYSRTNE